MDRRRPRQGEGGAGEGSASATEPGSAAQQGSATEDGSGTPQPDVEHPDVRKWKEAVRKAYPRMDDRSYFVPSVHLNETKRIQVERPSGAVQVAIAPDASATQDDHAQQHVLHCFQALGDSEIMYVLSEVDFFDYLKYMKQYRKKSGLNLPRAYDPEVNRIMELIKQRKEKWKNKTGNKGDFDILVISRRWGVLAAEIKSKGFKFGDTEWNAGQVRAVKEKIDDAIFQMFKFQAVLDHILPELNEDKLRTISLILPYVSREQLGKILANDEELKRELREALEVNSDQDPLDFCLLADDVPERDQPWEVTDDVKEAFRNWWHRVMVDGKDPSAMTPDRYEDLVARFCGPATRVSLRTLGEGVDRLGNEVLDVCLTQEQVDILNEDLHFLWLLGPPGTGKTLVMIEKAREWLQDGMEVHIISLFPGAKAAAELIRAELSSGGVSKEDLHLHHLHEPNLNWVFGILKALKSCVTEGRKMAFLIDETNGDTVDVFHEVMMADSTHLSNIDKLIQTIAGMEGIQRLWAVISEASAAGLQDFKACCDETNMEIRELRRAMRTLPAITREVAKSSIPQQGIQYDPDSLGVTPLPASDGARVLALRHLSEGEGHMRADIGDCRLCGEQLGELLSTELGVGTRTGICYRDVFILTYPGDRTIFSTEPTAVSPFLQALHQADFPVVELRADDDDLLRDIVRRDRPDEVIVSDYFTVRGLERKVIVWLEPFWIQQQLMKASAIDAGRFYAMSRCASQLVCIASPELATESGWRIWQPPPAAPR